MRLVTFRHADRTRVGAWLGQEVIDIYLAFSNLYPHLNFDESCSPSSMLEHLRLGDTAMAKARAVVERVGAGESSNEFCFPLNQVSILTSLPRPGKILAVDYNYPSFIRDARLFLQRQKLEVPEWDVPAHPWIFGKFASTVIGPGETIRKPRQTETLDAEGELAVVIGKEGRFIPEAEVWSYVAGYTLFNDISDRAVEFRPSPSINHRLYVLGKNNDTFGPMGPCLFTPDEIGNPSSLSLEVAVNDDILYRYRIGEAAYSVPALISFCSQLFRLDPGDVIATGSGGGCGGFQDPARYLKSGDRVRVQIPGLPPLENMVEDELE
jgi:acylpyruvate hydrolase